jgi:hypothetical protein
METTETVTADPRRVRLAEIAAELAEVDEAERKSRAEMPEYRIENVGNGEIAATVQRIQSKMWECDSRRAVLKAERKSIALALNESVTREARVREQQVFATVLEALTPFVKEMQSVLDDVSECRAGANIPTWRSKLTAADLARVAANGGSLVDPDAQDLDTSEWSPAFRRGR